MARRLARGDGSENMLAALGWRSKLSVATVPSSARANASTSQVLPT